MKKSKKIISIVMAVILMFSSLSCISSAADLTEVKEKSYKVFSTFATKLVAGILTGALDTLNFPIRNNPSFIDEADYQNTDFYEGTEEFLKQPGENNVWMLGSSAVSLVPDDYSSGDYYLGGYIMIENSFSNKVEDVADDMKARIIAIDDNSGRGVSLFATIDCIGITNNDIKEIRKLFAADFTAKYPEKKIASINVFSTHAHSGIDTEGLWTNVVGKVFKNLARSAVGAQMETGTNHDYMEFLFKKVADGMMDACAKMKPGKLTYAVKDIGAGYFSNKNRSSASGLDTNLTRLTFIPDDGSRGTIISSIGAHPDVAGLPLTDHINKGRTISGDYVYYMGEYINNYGYDFMFFNGAICGIYMGRGLTNDSQPSTYRYEQSQRYGYEMAKIALSLTKTEEEIKADAGLYDQNVIDSEIAYVNENGGDYTLWCENWTPVEEVEVEPYFNIKLSTVMIPVTNSLIKMAGKLNLANYSVIKSKGFGKYKINVEIGYIEFGRQLKVCMVPGEFCADLIKGGTSLTAEGSFSGKAFDAPTLYDLFGDVTVFGLANDAIGYIVPDNDFSMAIVYDHYQEMISLGKDTASSIMNGFAKLAEELS